LVQWVDEHATEGTFYSNNPDALLVRTQSNVVARYTATRSMDLSAFVKQMSPGSNYLVWFETGANLPGEESPLIAPQPDLYTLEALESQGLLTHLLDFTEGQVFRFNQ
jgi:hypothetical protein